MNFQERTNSRIIAMMALYAYEINKESDLEKTINVVKENYNLNLRDQDEEIKYDEKFLKEITLGTIDKINYLDYVISLVLEKYTIDALSYVDRNILRLGSYEILYMHNPKQVVINEFVNVAKVYSEIEGFNASKFDNAILDKIANGNFKEE